MHTFSSRMAEGAFARALLLAWSVGEMAVALVVHGALKIVVWQQRARERNRLASMDEHMLRDIGLSRSQVTQETGKPFWQA
jgi:uncharacterized protein YjiS (DUF1127 family)